MSKQRVITALDVPAMREAMRIVSELGSNCLYKVGKRLYTACGPLIVKTIQKFNGEVFLDLKYHDIPNTVAEASMEAAGLGVKMFNLHALSGSAAMELTMTELDKKFSSSERPKVLGVTVLTSYTYDQLVEIRLVPALHYADPSELQKQQDFHTKDLVLHFAKLAQKAGLDGVVASPQEAAVIRKACGKDFLIVTPGVRPAEAESNDQARIATPSGAIKQGSDWLVIGRPIIGKKFGERLPALQSINEEVRLALA